MNATALKAWAKTAHDLSARNGFWDAKNGKPHRDIVQALNLIIEEIGEAHTGRRGMRYLYQPLPSQGLPEEQISGIDIETAREFMGTYMKDTFEEELADIALRVFDLIGGMVAIHGQEAEDVLNVAFSPVMTYKSTYDEMMMELTRTVCHTDFERGTEATQSKITLLLKIVRIVEFVSATTFHTPARSAYDLTDLMRVKHAYNEGRPRKHGKQY